MENYEKSEVLKSQGELGEDVVRCSGHGRLHGYVHFAKKMINEKRTVTISGIGGAVNKAVSTAELVKQELSVHQTNKIYFVSITEVWKPKENQELQNIEVDRKVPAILITLELEEPAFMGPGYQAPDLTSPPVKPVSKKPKFKKFSAKPKDKDDYPFPNHQKQTEQKFKDKKRKPRNNGRKSAEKEPSDIVMDSNPQSDPLQPPAATAEEPSDVVMDAEAEHAPAQEPRTQEPSDVVMDAEAERAPPQEPRTQEPHTQEPRDCEDSSNQRDIDNTIDQSNSL